MKSARNIPASVRQQLLNRAKTDRRPFNELLQYYAMERFLYRLSLSVHSVHAERFILKGALMLRIWRSPGFRPTMDIDMLGITSNKEVEIIRQIQDILIEDVEPDGLDFDPDSIQCERITEDGNYEGIRLRFQGKLGNARIYMQLDIGFGDAVYPKPEKLKFPTILDSPAPYLFCYSRESSIAEKFEAMVKLGILNSRMKDFYDIWLLSRLYDFDGNTLTEAVRITFERRGRKLSPKIEAFTESFMDTKQSQWIAFWKRLQQRHVSASFKEIVIMIDNFISPIISDLFSENLISKKWSAPGPWTEANKSNPEE